MSSEHRVVPIRKLDREIITHTMYDSPSIATRTYDFINNFNTPVRVVYRGGLHVILPPARDPNFGQGFFIIERLRIGSNVNANVGPTLFEGNQGSPDFLVLQNFYTRRQQIRVGNGLDEPTWIKTSFTNYDAILASESGVYIVSADIVISRVFDVNNIFVGPFHPLHAAEAESVKTLDDEFDLGGMGFFIDYVDNSGLRGNSYTNVNGRIYALIPRKDEAVADGYYLAEKQRLRDTFIQHGEVRYITFADAANYQIYQTLDEAKAQGNPDNFLTIQERRAKEQANIDKERAQREKIEAERQLKELNNELQRFKHDSDMRAIERSEREKILIDGERLRQREDERYDREQEQRHRQRVYERQEAIGIWKFAIALVTLIVGFIGVLSKLSPSK